MTARDYYYREPRDAELRDPVKLAALARADALTLEQMAELARIGVCELKARNAPRLPPRADIRVDVVTGDFA